MRTYKKGYKSKNNGKVMINFIATILIVVFVVGGLGYVSKGFADWDYKGWIESVMSRFKPVVTPTANIAELPITISFADLTMHTVEIEDLSFCVYTMEFEGLFGLEDLDALSANVIIASEDFDETYIRPVSLIDDSYAWDINFVEEGILQYLGFGLMDGADFNFEALEIPIEVSEDNSIFMIMFYSEEKELFDDFEVTFTAVELTVLETVTNIAYADDYLTWDSVANADHYIISGIGDDDMVSEVSSLNLTELTVGTYSITIQAVAEIDTAYADSELSAEYTFVVGDVVLTSTSIILTFNDIDYPFIDATPPSLSGTLLLFVGDTPLQDGNTIIIALEDYDDPEVGTFTKGTMRILSLRLGNEALEDYTDITIDFTAMEPEITIEITQFGIEHEYNGTWVISGLTYTVG